MINVTVQKPCKIETHTLEDIFKKNNHTIVPFLMNKRPINLIHIHMGDGLFLYSNLYNRKKRRKKPCEVKLFINLYKVS